MGAGILPTTIRNGKIWFLFGKENKFEKSAPGFSDFGGGKDNNETPLETAIREGGEELTGFLGTDEQLKKQLKAHGTYNIDFAENKYRTHIFPMKYDPYLEKYYNNNQKFIKIGKSKDFLRRMQHHNSSHADKINVDFLFETDNYVNTKQKLFIPEDASKGLISRSIMHMSYEYKYDYRKIIDYKNLIK